MRPDVAPSVRQSKVAALHAAIPAAAVGSKRLVVAAALR